jgi:hypothetical protein
MKTTNQIQIAVQEGDPNLSDYELRLCVEVQRNIEHFITKDLMELIEAIREDKPTSFIKMKAEFAFGTIERMFNASKKPPDEWLGPDNIPGSKGYKKRLAFGKKLIDKILKDKGMAS